MMSRRSISNSSIKYSAMGDFELESFSGYQENLGCCDSIPRLMIGIFFVALLAALGIITAFLGVSYLNVRLREVIDSRIVLTNTNNLKQSAEQEQNFGYKPRFPNWVNNTTPQGASLVFNFYLYNITNPEDVLKGKRPRIAELGPYSYRIYWSKFNVRFYDDDNRVTYREWKKFVFEQETSFPKASPQTDKIYTIDLGTQMASGYLSSSFKPYRWLPALAFDLFASQAQSSLISVAIVDELLFSTQSRILSDLNSWLPKSPLRWQLQRSLDTLEEAQETERPREMFTGKRNIDAIDHVISYDDKTTLSCWGSPDANIVSGNIEGTQFQPLNDKSSITELNVWWPELFRPVSFTYENSTDTNNIRLWKFRLAAQNFWNAERNTENKKYYQFSPDGVANVTSCLGPGAPIFMSKPHFLDADSYYLQSMSGMFPDRDQHDSYLDVEPNTGTVIRSAKRLQYNVNLQPNIMLWPNATKHVMVPLFWTEVLYQAPDNVVDAMRELYWWQLTMVIIHWFCLVAGIMLIVVAFGLGLKTWKLHRDMSGYRIVGL